MGPIDVVRSHIGAFNAGDLDGVMATFDEGVVFSTADQVLVGRRAVADLFQQALGAGLDAHIQLQRAVVEGESVACELTERLTLGSQTVEFALAAFYTVRDGRLARVKIYREGATGDGG